MKADAIRDHAFAHHGRQLGSKIAHLIGVRKQNQVGFRRGNDLRQRERISIGRVGFEEVMLYQQNFRDIFARQVLGEIRHALSNHQRADGAACVGGDLLRGHQRFKAGVIPFALALLGNYQDFHLRSRFFTALQRKSLNDTGIEFQFLDQLGGHFRRRTS